MTGNIQESRHFYKNSYHPGGNNDSFVGGAREMESNRN